MLIDRAYLGRPVVDELRQGGVLITAKPWPSRNAGRFTKEDFEIRLARRDVTCPATSAPRSAASVARRSSPPAPA